MGRGTDEAKLVMRVKELKKKIGHKFSFVEAGCDK